MGTECYPLKGAIYTISSAAFSSFFVPLLPSPFSVESRNCCKIVKYRQNYGNCLRTDCLAKAVHNGPEELLLFRNYYKHTELSFSLSVSLPLRGNPLQGGSLEEEGVFTRNVNKGLLNDGRSIELHTDHTVIIIMFVSGQLQLGLLRQHCE